MKKWFLMFALVLAMIGNAQAGVFFYDDFESYTVGQAITPPQGPDAPIGGYWDYRNSSLPGSWSNTTVVDNPVLAGSKALKIIRDSTTQTWLDAWGDMGNWDGKTVTITQPFYMNQKWAMECYFTGAEARPAGWYTGATGKFWVQNLGSWEDTGIAAFANEWDIMTWVINLEDKGQGSWGSSYRIMGGTYSLTLTRPDGTQIVLGEDLIMTNKQTDGWGRLEMHAVPGTQWLTDNVKMEIIPEPLTLALLGVGALIVRRKNN